MIIEVTKQDIDSLYYKAKHKYKECIKNKGNEFLKNELDVPWDSVLLIEEDIKIVFSQHVAYGHLLHVSFSLYVGDKEVGKYVYFEDERGNSIDDSLVFY